MSTEKPFVKEIVTQRLETISEQVYKKGTAAAGRAITGAMQVDSQFNYVLHILA